MFAEADATGSGSIGFPEFMSMMGRRMKQVCPIFPLSPHQHPRINKTHHTLFLLDFIPSPLLSPNSLVSNCCIQTCNEQILLNAFKTFDPEGRGYIERKKLSDVLTSYGDRLTQQEVCSSPLLLHSPSLHSLFFPPSPLATG